MRTCGCCSHICSIKYYLSCGKNLDKLPNPDHRLNSILINFSNDDLENDVSMSFDEPPRQKMNRNSIERNSSITITSLANNEIHFRSMSNNLPQWGGRITLELDDFFPETEYFSECEVYKNLKIQNTCTIDYFLLAIWCSSLISNTFMKALNESKMIKKNYFNTIIFSYRCG